ncbi:MAG: hypothetical protein LJE59_09520 [Chromatiaceae bacterium]|nr:hypothetical protein [Chromatiaceae bacterium]
MRGLSAVLCAALLPGLAGADWRGEIALEGRGFTQAPVDPAQHDANLSLSGEIEFHTRWDEGRQSFTLKPFARLDQHDEERTHADLREAVWLYHDDGLEIRLGVTKVFWGVTEVYHLVDIINQTDVVENPDGEQKLGQPMLKLSLERDWGTLDMFYLPWFRERRYPSLEGRPRTQPRIAAELADYENHRRQYHPDFALRWSRSLGDWDLGVAHFYGTGREPSLTFDLDRDGQPVLIPHYEIIHQTSLDVQGAVGDWLWKLEALYRQGQGPSFFVATGGFEYTFYGILEGSGDLGVLTELMWDERGTESTSPFNRDLFLGLRWAANDVAGTEILAGVIQDWDNGSRLFNLEASRRMGNAWKLGLQARLWNDVVDSDPLFGLRSDDYIELKVTRFF